MAELKKNFLCVIFLMAVNQSFSQGLEYERNLPGRLVKAPSCKIKGFKIDALFEVINRIPMIKEPKGYEVQEAFFPSIKGKVYEARLTIRLPAYYRINKGPLKLQGEPPGLNIYVNDPTVLMNNQSKLFEETTTILNLPVMFTDTFSITYKNLNGVRVGHGITTTYNSNRPFHVLNDRQTKFFKPITQEEYLKFWIGKLGLDIDKDEKGLDESKSNLALIANNPALKDIPELEKQLKAYAKWVDFLKSRKQYFEKKLAQMSAEEKKASAHYALYTDIASMMDKNGKYLENISGRIPNEPAEVGDTVMRTTIFTFVKDPWDATLPKSAFQLIMIPYPLRDNVTGEIKALIDNHFYPALSFNDLSALMYK